MKKNDIFYQDTHEFDLVHKTWAELEADFYKEKEAKTPKKGQKRKREEEEEEEDEEEEEEEEQEEEEIEEEEGLGLGSKEGAPKDWKLEAERGPEKIWQKSAQIERN